MTRIFMVAMSLLLLSSQALAAPVPTRGAMKGAIIAMNEQFHLIGFNYRIAKIRWVPANDAFAKAVSPYTTSGYTSVTAPMGLLVFQVPVKNTQKEEDYVPLLTITAMYKDGTAVDGIDNPFSASGVLQSSRKLYPGQGATVDYTVPNVPKPTKGNPLVKLILKNTEHNDPGYPPVYRLLNPVVSH